MTLEKSWFVVPAAGRGLRMASETPKQYLELRGKTLAEHTLEKLLSLKPAGIVVAVNPSDRHWENLPVFGSDKVHIIHGGKERADSVLNSLVWLSDRLQPDAWVLVHDLARPCVRVEDICTLFKTLAEDDVGGLLATPVSDTIKQVAGFEVRGTLDRSALWAAQTPQMFRLGMLQLSLEQMFAEGLQPTDEASAIEFNGHTLHVVEGSRDNIKVTCPEDLMIASAILEYQQALEQ